MKVRVICMLMLAAVAFGAQDQNKAVQRTERAARLMDEIMGTPDKSIPLHLLRKAHCIVIIPGMKKVGFIFAGKFGKGVVVCRGEGGEGWTGPASVRLEGGSFGLQIGGSSTDVVLLVMNENGIDKLISSKFTLGADMAVAGGPVGRSLQAQTDAQMSARILSYSRSRGVFAGVSIEGATMRPDKNANMQLYGRDVTSRQILYGEVSAPMSTQNLIATLVKYSPALGLPEVDEEAESQRVTLAAADEIPSTPTLLKITSEPAYAEVEINQNFNGLTPRSKAVKPGEYQVTVRKKGYEDWTQSVSVEPGETVELHAELVDPNAEEEVEEEEVQVDYQKTAAAANSSIKVIGLR